MWGCSTCAAQNPETFARCWRCDREHAAPGLAALLVVLSVTVLTALGLVLRRWAN